jgi:ectoine hydroxylase-related dioxygenase (phytanoyl-CoA dioxygenase family)
MKICSTDRRLHEVLGVLLENDVNLVGMGQCMYKEALRGNEAGLHQDAIYPGGEGFRDIASTFTYLVPTSIERGCIWLVPYSQRDGLLRHEEIGNRVGCLPLQTCDFERAVPLPGEAGDTLIWNAMLVHGSKANATDMARPALVIRYGRRGSEPR